MSGGRLPVRSGTTAPSGGRPRPVGPKAGAAAASGRRRARALRVRHGAGRKGGPAEPFAAHTARSRRATGVRAHVTGPAVRPRRISPTGGVRVITPGSRAGTPGTASRLRAERTPRRDVRLRGVHPDGPRDRSAPHAPSPPGTDPRAKPALPAEPVSADGSAATLPGAGRPTAADAGERPGARSRFRASVPGRPREEAPTAAVGAR